MKKDSYVINLKMMSKKIISLVCAAALTVSTLTLSSAFFKADATEQIAYDAGYVGLGDSIARGYGNQKGKAATDMLGSLLLDKGHAKNAVVRYNNYAQDGDESSHLLSKVRNSPEVIDAIKNSKLVTISIGGNNIMQEMGRQVAVAVGIDPESNYNYTNDAIAYIQANPISGSAKVISHFNSTAFKNIMNAKIEEVNQDLPLIIKEIKKLRSDAVITVQTLYCPTNFVFLSSFLDGYITKLNNVITANASCGYSVVDIHSAFENYSGSEDLTYTSVLSGFFDPHPTQAGQKIIFDNLYPYLEPILNNLPTKTKAPDYQTFGNLRQNVKYAFDFDSSAFVAGTSIFESGNAAKNYIDIGSSQTANSAYDFKIVNTNHIKGLEFTMNANYDCTPIKLKLNSAVNGTSFLSGTSVIPSDSTDSGMLFYVDTTNYTGSGYLLLQFEETDFDGTTTRRGLKANSEAYMQDANGNFTLPVTINSNNYLFLPQNYMGYIAIPFNSFASIWGTTDINFAVDLKNVQNINIYKGSEAGAGKLVFDEFIFYGAGVSSTPVTPQAGQTKTVGMPNNLVTLFNFEDNRFVSGKSLISDPTYRKAISKYLSVPQINSTPQFAFDIVDNTNVSGTNSAKAFKFATTSAQSVDGQYSGIGLNLRQEMGIYEKPCKRGNLVSSSSESDGIAFYIDLTEYTASSDFSLNVTWHETDCGSNGLPVFTANSDGTNTENQTSRNINASYGNAEGVLSDGTSVTLPLSGNSVSFPTLANGQKFKGWVKLPFAAFQTCWGSADANNAVDFYDIGSFDLYFGSYPSRLGSVVIDEFSFYGPAFAQLSQNCKTYIPTADVMNLSFNQNGTVSDLTQKSNVTKNGNPQIGLTTVTHKGKVASLNALKINASGQGLTATFPSISSATAQAELYKNGFSVEAFAVNSSPSGEQGIISTCQSGGWGLFTVNNSSKFIVNTAGSYTENYSQGSIPSNELTHYVGVYDFNNNIISIYINGELSHKMSITGTITPGYGDAYNKVAIGGDIDYYGAFTQSLMSSGIIACARIYSSPLNSIQAKALYNNQNSVFN